MSDETTNALDKLLLPPSNSICFGTRRVLITTVRGGSDDTSTTTGMLATFSCPNEHDSSPCLWVLLTDGKLTFSGHIHPRDATRVQWSDYVVCDDAESSNNGEQQVITDEQKVKILSSFLLQKQDRIQVTYVYNAKEQQGGDIELVMKETMSSTGLVRTLGEHTLEPVQSNLTFCNMIGSFLNTSISEIHKLETEQKRRKLDLLGWKDTAEKLTRDWQTEKDGLLDRFLELYKKAHEQLGESRLEVQRLKRELQEARANSNTMAQSAATKKRPLPTPSYAALPDDNDAQQFDSEMVEMLAAGKPTRGCGGGDAKKKKSNSGADCSTFKTANNGAMRTNPHTGAKEVFDAEALFQDPSFFEASQNVAPTETEKMEVDPVMAIASKLSAKEKKNGNDAPAAKRAKKDSDNVNGKRGSNPLEEDDPIMAAASKLFASKENTNNGDSK